MRTLIRFLLPRRRPWPLVLLAVVVLVFAYRDSGLAAPDDASAPPSESPATVVYIAQGDDFPDALAGSVLAAAHNAPLLLVSGAAHRDELPPDTAVTLARLRPDRIVVLGGPAAVSDAVVEDLGAFAADVRRLAGATRYETATLIAEALPRRVADADRLDGLDSTDLLRGDAAVVATIDEGGNVSRARGVVSAGVASTGRVCVLLDAEIDVATMTVQVTPRSSEGPAVVAWQPDADDCVDGLVVTTFRYVEGPNGKGQLDAAPVAFSLTGWVG